MGTLIQPSLNADFWLSTPDIKEYGPTTVFANGKATLFTIPDDEIWELQMLRVWTGDDTKAKVTQIWIEAPNKSLEIQVQSPTESGEHHIRFETKLNYYPHGQ